MSTMTKIQIHTDSDPLTGWRIERDEATNSEILTAARKLVILCSQLCEVDLRDEVFEILKLNAQDPAGDDAQPKYHMHGSIDAQKVQISDKINRQLDTLGRLREFRSVVLRNSDAEIDRWSKSVTCLETERNQFAAQLNEANNRYNMLLGWVGIFFGAIGLLKILIWISKGMFA